MDEQVFRIAPSEPPRATILFIPPLFEEANRMRRTLVLAMRSLALEGFQSLIADLPGQNESLLPTDEADLDRWRSGVAAVAKGIDRPLIAASVRGGALLDDAAGADAWWRLAPVGGGTLLRTLLRARMSADREAGGGTTIEALRETARHAPLLLAGNRLSPAMIDQLERAEVHDVAPLRSVSPGEGADRIEGSALWLRAEPGEDAAMAAAIAADISSWSTTCGVT